MKILGYSERGIINSLIFSIGEDKVLMDKFIGEISLPNPFELGNPKRYTILLEQSFSDFGDADLVIIIHYKDEEVEKAEDKKVLFIEGKVNTSLSSWNIIKHYNNYDEGIKFDGYSSNLFYQLYFKTLLIKHWNDINVNKEFKVDSKFRERKIGNNPIVHKAFNLIECSQAYYIGLIPTRQDDFDKFKGKLDFDMHFLLWEKVEKFCQDNKLDKVLKIFEHNDEQIYKRDKKIKEYTKKIIDLNS
jgi:hypothetical protein